MDALVLVLTVLSWVLLAFFLMLVARFVLSLIVMFAPQWHPKGPLLLLFEVVYSVDSPDHHLYMDRQQSINLELKRRLEQMGIDLAAPARPAPQPPAPAAPPARG